MHAQPTDGTDFGSGAEVEALYSPVLWSWRPRAPRQAEEQLQRRLKEAAVQVIHAHSDEERYGASLSQRLVWRRPHAEGSRPVLVSVFGGCWWDQGENATAALAFACLSAGVDHVGVSYDSCPREGVEGQVAQVLAAFELLLRRLPPDCKLTVCGYSSGAHLAAMVLQKFSGEKRIQCYILISGLYDLRPLLWHSRNSSLRLTPESAVRLSPLTAPLPPTLARVMVLVAEIDSPVYHRQGEAFVDFLKSAAFISTRLSTVCAADHLEVGEALCDPRTPLTEFVIKCAKGQEKCHELCRSECS